MEEDEVVIADKEPIEVLDSLIDFVIDEEVLEVFEVDIDLVGVFVLKGLLLIFGVPEFVGF